METKGEVNFMINLEYGSKYCYEIISWNLKHLSANMVTVDNISCFEPIKGIYGSTSIFFNKRKNELIFRCNLMHNFICTEITNKKKYDSFTLENFKIHFNYFYSLIENFMTPKEVRFCNNCLTPSYQALCKECYVKSIMKVDCVKCIENETKKENKASSNSSYGLKEFFKRFRKTN
jgi:hypothetical protein